MIFLPGVLNSYGAFDRVSVSTYVYRYPSTDNFDTAIWEYWQNRIGTKQKYGDTNSARITYAITGAATEIVLPNAQNYRATTTSIMHTYNCCFDSYGKFFCHVVKNGSTTRYLPACVIG